MLPAWSSMKTVLVPASAKRAFDPQQLVQYRWERRQVPDQENGLVPLQK
jgi:hypothetical protein